MIDEDREYLRKLIVIPADPADHGRLVLTVFRKKGEKIDRSIATFPFSIFAYTRDFVIAAYALL